MQEIVRHVTHKLQADLNDRNDSKWFANVSIVVTVVFQHAAGNASPFLILEQTQAVL
jgi:hypothetical protein